MIIVLVERSVGIERGSISKRAQVIRYGTN